jgi:hypothetical protein
MSRNISPAVIAAFIENLPHFSKLKVRLEVQPEIKRAAAQFFLDYYFRQIAGLLTNLFVESGSSLYYVMEKLSATLQRIHGQHPSPSLYLTTNNSLVYLYTMFFEQFPAFLFPWGSPDEKYGAFYGELGMVGSPDPDYGRKRLLSSDRKAVEGLLKLKGDIAKWDGATLILGATSGLQMSPNPVPKRETIASDHAFEHYRQLLADMAGPHTGSHRNKLFKRFLHDTNLPQVIFAEASKVDCEIDVTSCRFVYDDARAWHHALDNRPLAFCVSGPAAEVAAKRDLFAKREGMKVMDSSINADGIAAFLARTPEFVKRFELEALGLEGPIEEA